MFQNTEENLLHAFRPMNTALLIAIMLAVGFTAYSNTFHAEMVFDDHPFIISNQAVHMTKLTWNNVKTAATEGYPRQRYIPNISFAFNYYFGQLNTFGYHLVNLTIHLLTGLFLFFLIKNTLDVCPAGPRNIRPEIIAFFAALIWIIQPVSIQAVTYICQRMTSMVAMFYILSLLFYVKGRISMRRNPGKRLIPGLYFLICLLASVCAVATKENAGTLPFFILLYEWFFFQNLKLDWSGTKILWTTVFVILFLCTVWYLADNPLHRILVSYQPRNFNLIERVMTEWRIMIYYISLFVWAPPGRLILDHDYPLSLSPFHPPTTMIALAAILSLLALAGYMAKKDRPMAFCILWFFGTQVIESTIIGIELIFEHRTYIPFMMTSLMFVLIVFRVMGKKPVAYGVLMAVVLIFSVWTHERNHTWRDPVTFWSDALTKSNNKARVYENLAFAYQQKEDWAKAALYYKKVITTPEIKKRTHFPTYANLGAVLLRLDRFFDAAFYYSKALEKKDATTNILQPLAFALAHIGEVEAAKAYYLMALNIQPNDELAKKELDALTAFLNQYPDPNDQIRHLLFESPDNPSLLLKQGDLFAHQGMTEQAIISFQKAENLTRENDDMLRQTLLSRLARMYAVTRRFEDAIEVYLRLIALAPDNGMAYYNLASVYSVTGDMTKTKELLKKAEQKGIDVTEKIKIDPNFYNLKIQ